MVVTEQGVESLVLDHAFDDYRAMYKGRRPYTGALYKPSSLDIFILIILMNL